MDYVLSKSPEVRRRANAALFYGAGTGIRWSATGTGFESLRADGIAGFAKETTEKNAGEKTG
jgi:hypothetical protein